MNKTRWQAGKGNQEFTRVNTNFRIIKITSNQKFKYSKFYKYLTQDSRASRLKSFTVKRTLVFNPIKTSRLPPEKEVLKIVFLLYSYIFCCILRCQRWCYFCCKIHKHDNCFKSSCSSSWDAATLHEAQNFWHFEIVLRQKEVKCRNENWLSPAVDLTFWWKLRHLRDLEKRRKAARSTWISLKWGQLHSHTSVSNRKITLICILGSSINSCRFRKKFLELVK